MLLVEPHQFSAQLDERLAGEICAAAVSTGLFKFRLRVQCHLTNAVGLFLHRVDAKPLENAFHLFPVSRQTPEIVLQRQQVGRLHLVVAGEPCSGLRNGVITEVLSIRHLHALSQLAEDVVRKFIDGVWYRDCGYFMLHLNEFFQRDRGADLSKCAALLIFQNGKTGIPVFDVGCHDLQFQAVIERLQNLLLRVIEIGNLIGRRKKGDGRNWVCMTLVGVLTLIKRREKRVQDTVVALEYLIQQHNVRLRDLARRLDNRFAWTQQRHRFAVGRQLVRSQIKHIKGIRGTFHLPQAIHRAL